MMSRMGRPDHVATYVKSDTHSLVRSIRDEAAFPNPVLGLVASAGDRSHRLAPRM